MEFTGLSTNPIRRTAAMQKFLRILVVLPALLFIVMGLRWVTDPAGAASSLGMSLMEGVGRSSQIADCGALFFAMGAMTLTGLITAKRTWFYAPALMLSLAAVLRVLAWLFHGAALTLDMIAVEVVVAILLLVAAPRLSQDR
jgi:hypothetical protein